MASTYTANNGIEKIGSGEQAGTWGNTTNLNLDIIDRILNGVGIVFEKDGSIKSSGNFIEVPTEWTQYEFDLSAYEGQTIRIAIHYVGNDSFVLQMDSFVVEGTLGVGDYEANNFDYVFNPTTRELNLSSTKIIDG